MKIAWLTPLSRKTGVAKYSLCAVRALSRLMSVDVWTIKRDDNYRLEGLNLFEIDSGPEALKALNGYDHVVYNLGNNVEFHNRIYEAYRRKKGIVILHDRVMHDFFAFLYIFKYSNPGAYSALMKEFYGAEGESAARAFLKKPEWGSAENESHTLIEQCLWNATGAVAHSVAGLDGIKGITAIPSELIYFPFHAEEGGPFVAKKDLRLPEDRVILLQYGHVTPNKNPHKVLEAIAESPDLKKRVFFVLAGDHNSQYGQGLKEYIREKGLKDAVLLTGYLDDGLLRSYLNHADVCLNLRFPSLEGASWSVVEQLFSRKAVIAAGTGFFDEIPADCILRIATPIDTQELGEAIMRLASDEGKRKTMTENAFNFAAGNFSEEKYAGKFLSLLKRAGDFRKVIDRIDTASDEAAGFVKTDEDREKAAEKVCRELASLKAGKP